MEGKGEKEKEQASINIRWSKLGPSIKVHVTTHISQIENKNLDF